METIAEEVFNNNSDYAVRKRCQDREDYLRWQATYKKKEEQLEADLAEANRMLSEKDRELSEKDKEIERLKAMLNQ